MFFTQLNNDLQKILFLELALLLTMTKGTGDASETISRMELGTDDLLSAFTRNITTVEADKLFAYDKTEELLPRKILQTSDNKFNESLYASFSFFDFELFIKNDGRMRTLRDFPAFHSCLSQSIDEIMPKYSDDQEVMSEVMQGLIAQGVNMASLTPAVIQKAMISIPRVRGDILNRTVFWLFQPKFQLSEEGHASPCRLSFNKKEQKIFICELMNIALSDGELSEEEKDILAHVCDQLSMDKGYIDDFIELLKSLAKVTKELNDLINE